MYWVIWGVRSEFCLIVFTVAGSGNLWPDVDVAEFLVTLRLSFAGLVWVPFSSNCMKFTFSGSAGTCCLMKCPSSRGTHPSCSWRYWVRSIHWQSWVCSLQAEDVGLCWGDGIAYTWVSGDRAGTRALAWRGPDWGVPLEHPRGRSCESGPPVGIYCFSKAYFSVVLQKGCVK